MREQPPAPPPPPPASRGGHAFALIYLTFFLDNVLLTVLVPIIPDWVRGPSLALWARHDAPLAALLNGTVHGAGAGAEAEAGVGGAQAVVGAVLGAKAAAQLLGAPLCAVEVSRRGPAPVLRAATALLALAAIVFCCCGLWCLAPWCAWCACAGRAVHGAGAAGAGVAGLALAAQALPPARRDRAVGALLGAVALGVLVGYPLGGAASSLCGRGTPFLLLAAALLVDLAMQYRFLDAEEYNMPYVSPGAGAGSGPPACGVLRAARRGATGWCAGAVLLSTSVMAALEPCLPLWITDKFHTQRWQRGLVFVPDSAGYLLAASLLGGAARRLGPERVALAGQLAVALAALALPAATSVLWLSVPHVALGAGLGAVDAALVPALLARHSRRGGGGGAALAALLQAAASAAYAVGPAAGGAAAAGLGFAAALRALGAANLLYAALLYRALARHPLSTQWGAPDDDEDSASDGDGEGEGGGEPGSGAGRGAERTPLRPLHYTQLR